MTYDGHNLRPGMLSIILEPRVAVRVKIDLPYRHRLTGMVFSSSPGKYQIFIFIHNKGEGEMIDKTRFYRLQYFGLTVPHTVDAPEIGLI